MSSVHVHGARNRVTMCGALLLVRNAATITLKACLTYCRTIGPCITHCYRKCVHGVRCQLWNGTNYRLPLTSRFYAKLIYSVQRNTKKYGHASTSCPCLGLRFFLEWLVWKIVASCGPRYYRCLYFVLNSL